MQNEQDAGNGGKYKKQSISFPPGLYEQAKTKADKMRPRTSVSAYVCSLVERDLEREAAEREPHVPVPFPKKKTGLNRTRKQEPEEKAGKPNGGKK